MTSEEAEWHPKSELMGLGSVVFLLQSVLDVSGLDMGDRIGPSLVEDRTASEECL